MQSYTENLYINYIILNFYNINCILLKIILMTTKYNNLKSSKHQYMYDPSCINNNLTFNDLLENLDVIPPDATITSPVIKEEAGEQRNDIIEPISSGQGKKLPFNRYPFLNIVTGIGLTPAIEETYTIEPPPLEIKCGATSFSKKTGINNRSNAFVTLFFLRLQIMIDAPSLTNCLAAAKPILDKTTINYNSMFIVYPSVDAVMIATFPSSGLAIFENIFFNCIPNEETIGILNL
ncbi:hypothetical protein AGLY_014502 [Aphis glycines]|uniref:Uncharacterized protein n=1 Tax=Aphis glycines TaxID=307491 RepID=A0A6G0T3U7_APHGL|nr:hypothetical protein AGLY_014502 [Aphis glycines]